MSEERFMKLTAETGGFEFSQAYRDEKDILLGGKGDTFWYAVLQDGKVREMWIGKSENGVWEDMYVKGIRTIIT